MNLLIYIPAFNEEENIGSVLNSLPKRINQIDKVQILVVDDGSGDNTANIAKLTGAHVLKHTTNKGLGKAFQSAVQYALEKNIDILVSIDADRQFNSNQIPEIIKPILKQKADMVTGNRFNNGIPENMPKTKYWGNRQMSKIITIISGKNFKDVSCGFRAYNRDALLRLNLFGSFTYTQETILDMVYKGLRVVEYPVDVKYSGIRESKIVKNVFSYAFKTIKIILDTVRDYKPMVFFGGLAGIFFLLTLLLETFVFTFYFSTGEFTPYKVVGLLGLVSFIFGLFLGVIGLLGNMINRIRRNQEKMLFLLKKDFYKEK
jgi:glycosyltransferase involved in cell wall biosynthesis